MSGRFSRRQLLGAAGVGAAGLAGAGMAFEALGSSDDDGGGPGGGGAGDDARRNVVMVVVDSLRADHLGCYGSDVVRTPNIDALARESMRFANCFPEAMPTVPARRTLLTGQRTWPFFGWEPWDGMATRAGWEPIRPEIETIVRSFRRQGWWTGMVVDNPFLGFTNSFEPVRRSATRFVRVLGQRGERRPYERIPVADAARRLPEEMRDSQSIDAVRKYLANNGDARDERQYTASRLYRAAGGALAEAASQQRPFFLYVDGFDPHEPWAPPPEYMGMYGDPDAPAIADVLYRSADYLSEEEVDRLAAGYKAEVTLTDRWLGHMMDRLYDLGLDESTIVMLVSDHGVYVGERNWTGKGDRLLHPELTHVPLLLRDPGGRGAGRSSDWWATTVDMPRTAMEMAGAEVPPAFEGASLVPILEGREPDEQRPYAWGGYSNYSFVRDPDWVYIASNDRSYEALFDKRADPGEEHDVAAEHPAVVRRMWGRLIERAGGKPPPWYSEAEWDAEPRSSF